MGASVALIEAHKMGGDCLNTGCVPSKALIAASHRAHAVRSSTAFGIRAHEPDVDFAAVKAHVREVIAGIEPHDSVERFTKLGCTVIEARGRFIDRRTVEAGGRTLTAKRFVIATGSRAALPPIPGLADVPFHTNETIFADTTQPEHLIIIGGGPIGCELAQAHRRLGSAVTVLELGKILPKDDGECADVVRQALLREGVTLLENIGIDRVEPGPVVHLKDGRAIAGSHLLVAAGRKPNVEDLGLEAAGVAVTPKGIQVDARLRTSNKRIFAIGDCVGGAQFTHVAGAHAGIVIQNALLRVPAKAPSLIPWVTYTDPELAHVGEHARDGDQVLRWSFAENDRARAERATEGLVKVVVRGKRIVGTTIVGPQAGELLQPWILAIGQKLSLRAMASFMAPYPTLGEVNKRAAGSAFTAALFGPTVKRLVRWLKLLP
jgi:pyruvate/2-oxoglutarate dehydrogenase complex dihydrolipoamide dehydrogenase (E3) component